MTYDDAVALAKRLRELAPAIRGVELFGSTIKNGIGRDADYAVLVEPELARRWWTEAHALVRVRWPHALYGYRWIMKRFAPGIYAAGSDTRRHARLAMAARVIGLDLTRLADGTGALPDFEMFLVPADWRQGSELALGIFRMITPLADDTNTRGMLMRIAAEAKPVA